VGLNLIHFQRDWDYMYICHVCGDISVRSRVAILADDKTIGARSP